MNLEKALHAQLDKITDTIKGLENTLTEIQGLIEMFKQNDREAKAELKKNLKKQAMLKKQIEEYKKIEIVDYNIKIRVNDDQPSTSNEAEAEVIFKKSAKLNEAFEGQLQQVIGRELRSKTKKQVPKTKAQGKLKKIKRKI